METVRNQRWILPTLGIFAAIATNTAISASSLAGNGAFVLIPLWIVFLFIVRHSRAEMGFVWGRARDYILALLHPVVVLGLVAVAAWMSGATNIENTDWSSALFNFLFLTLITIAAAIITEEGFFRGWLWASLKRAGLSNFGIVALTGLAFGIWHLPYGLLVTGFDPTSAQIPLYIATASVIGVVWGLLRLISGSVVVTSVAHGLWNGVVYIFFNSGAETGALGIQETAIFGPETGVLGLGLSLFFAIGLWLWYRRSDRTDDANLDLNPNLGFQKQDLA